MLNSAREFVTIGDVFVQVDITETINVRTGDTEMQLACLFYNRNCADIGKASVHLYGDKESVRGDYHGHRLWEKHGNELLKQFQVIE